MQQNWKIKRHRLAATAPGSEGFLIDLSDIAVHYQPAGIRPSAFAMVRVDHDSSGMLAVNIPKNSLRPFQFGFPDVHADDGPVQHGDMNFGTGKESKETRKDSVSDDDRIQETHTLLRDAHRAIFYEQVFVPFPCAAHLLVNHFLPCPSFKLFLFFVFGERYLNW